MFEFNFKNQIALVTGGTRGIGEQVVSDLVELGAQVITTGANKEQISTLTKRASQNIKYFWLDFTVQNSIDAFLSDIDKYKKIDICINNAGINRIDSLKDIKISDWDDIFNVNVKGPMQLMQKLSVKMQKNNYGRIVNISSILGSISRKKRVTYSSSKYAIKGLTVASSIELARDNVLVNTVSPGFVLTDLTRGILTKKEIDDLIEQIPIGRMATPDDISKVILFLASSSNTYIVGQNIVVDGGYLNI